MALKGYKHSIAKTMRAGAAINSDKAAHWKTVTAKVLVSRYFNTGKYSATACFPRRLSAARASKTRAWLLCGKPQLASSPTIAVKKALAALSRVKR